MKEIIDRGELGQVHYIDAVIGRVRVSLAAATESGTRGRLELESDVRPRNAGTTGRRDAMPVGAGP